MTSSLCVGMLAACVIVCCASSDNANAVTIVHQNDADFLKTPSASASPFTSQTAGTVYFNEFGSVPNLYRSPFENAGSGNGGVYNAGNGGWQQPGFDKLPYTSIEANSSATYTFAAPETALSLLWGSPDSYNNIAFYSGKSGTGALEGVIYGNDLAIQTYGHDLVDMTLGGSTFRSVVLYSGSPAFEFADLKAWHLTAGLPLSTPLPAALPLFASGLGVMGWISRRRRQKHVVAAAL